MRKCTVAVAEKAQHRHHPVNRRHDRLGRLQASGGEGLPQGQQIGEDIDDHGRRAADMAAIGQYLRVQLFIQTSGAGARITFLTGHRQGCSRQRDGCLQARHTGRQLVDDAAQIAHLAVERFQESGIKFVITALQNQR